jgi:hypothetical protein
MAVPDKWVTVIDGAGIERRVRRVDAREIEEGKARRAAEAAGQVAEAKAEVVKPEPEPLVEVDDQSVEPKVSSKAKKAK